MLFNDSILWVAVFGAFSNMFLPAPDDDIKMRNAVFIDMMNMIFWFISGICGYVLRYVKSGYVLSS
jgi:hypothetical protein